MFFGKAVALESWKWVTLTLKLEPALPQPFFSGYKERMRETGMPLPHAYLEEILKLMELKGENPFKIRAIRKAIDVVSERTDLLERAENGTLEELPGIGKGISQLLTELLVRKTTHSRDELRASLPKGLEELTEISGVGPKKAQQLIEELGISSVGELEYACRENRLLKLKGFGEKVQEKILKGIEFRSSSQGLRRWAEVEGLAEEVLAGLLASVPGKRVEFTGPLRRRLETIDGLDILVEAPDEVRTQERLQEKARALAESLQCAFPIRLHFSSAKRFGFEWAKTTGSAEHWAALGNPAPFDAATEEEFYERLALPWIPPETRESGEEVAMAMAGKLKGLLPWDGVRGVFHVHTQWSDGTASVEQMVAEAKSRGYEYIGISDHSQSARYAQGLDASALIAQEKEIQKAQEKHPEIRVFWGIESDILADGSLDYPPEILRRFDFVIGSIHSRFQMDREAMTQRLIHSIRNPKTRFIGHLTGRLLLGRAGYELDMEKVIEEAARHDVAIEINAHPARLDIDWRWGPLLRRNEAMVSVNPDAHEPAGLEDVRHGICVARKALLSAKSVLNFRSAPEVEKWLQRK